MRAGKLRRRVAVQRATRGVDATGAPTETWTTWYTTWADVKSEGQSLRLADRQLLAQGGWLITMRYRDGVSTLNRLVYDGRTLRISSVSDVDEMHREMRLVCQDIS